MIDLFCGLGGWAEGGLATGYDVIGFDIERHCYGDQKYPAQLVLQDVLTLHGRQFRNAACIVASPPCQRYSYMAMPWTRAKREACWQRWERDSVFGDFRLNDLFDACFRIQREASEAAGHHIPMVVENVKGAQPWVGRAQAHFGSYFLWGDVRSVGGLIVSTVPKFGEGIRAARRGQKRNPDGTEHPQGSWFAIADSKERGANGLKVDGFNFHQHENGSAGGSFQSAAVAGLKTVGHANIRDGHTHTRHLTNQAESDGVKVPGNDTFKKTGQPCGKLTDPKYPSSGTKQGGEWWHDPESITRRTSSKSSARKAASAQIAKIPFDLAQWIARCFLP